LILEWRCVIPEGPELAYSRDRIKKLIESKSLTDLAVGLSGRYVKSPPQGLQDFVSDTKRLGSPRVDSVATHGKFMWWCLTIPGLEEEWYMHCTYGMSGGWYVNPSKHTAFVVEYSGSGVPITRDTDKLFFNDPRHFGTIKFVKGRDAHAKKLKTLGPCILTTHMTPDLFAQKVLSKPTRTIAEALMDQSTVAGVGNYLKAEILFDVGISPWRQVTDVSAEEYVKLCSSVLRIASESYKSQGATISTYRTPDGDRGTTQFDFKVYSMKFCPAGHEVHREETPEGRTSHWCPVCQK